MSKNTRKMRIRRMPKVSEINLGTDCVDSAKPELIEEGTEPVQCANGHWTIKMDLDKNEFCSRCPVEENVDPHEKAEKELEDILDRLHGCEEE